METELRLLPLGAMARRARVPQKWLREEAEGGRIPHLKAGNALLFDAPTVQDLLLSRARGEPSKGGG